MTFFVLYLNWLVRFEYFLYKTTLICYTRFEKFTFSCCFFFLLFFALTAYFYSSSFRSPIFFVLDFFRCFYVQCDLKSTFFQKKILPQLAPKSNPPPSFQKIAFPFNSGQVSLKANIIFSLKIFVFIIFAAFDL